MYIIQLLKTYSRKNIKINVFLKLLGIFFSLTWCVTVRYNPECHFGFVGSNLKEMINFLKFNVVGSPLENQFIILKNQREKNNNNSVFFKF